MSVDCKCNVEIDVCDDGIFYPIIFCPLHEAASDLLEALENLLKVVKPRRYYDSRTSEIEAAQAAIAKAKGEVKG